MPAYDAASFAPPAPVAHVTLRHPVSGMSVVDVPMLLDWGADITLIPKASAIALGAGTTSVGDYELIGFDGTRSIAAAVQLDLLFLKRAFKGKLLLIDQACGILGRDVLNHVVILLDGPQLTWSEHSRP